MKLAESLVCIELFGLICIDQIKEAEILPHLLNGDVIKGLIVKRTLDSSITNEGFSTLFAYGVAALEAKRHPITPVVSNHADLAAQ